ncbi:MAG TPA: hypothetical protein VK867_06445 [Candidatus Limnocylindrales bacterium]|nr:hypothetical protein [Candidatus Limnocylindrales bacterium]
MFATVRRYASLPDATVAAVNERTNEISAVLASVPGSVDALLIRTREGLLLLQVGPDEPSLIEAGRRFRAWVDDEIEGFDAAGEPDLWSGPVLTGSLPVPHQRGGRDAT